jgi:hypothetical protein
MATRINEYEKELVRLLKQRDQLDAKRAAVQRQVTTLRDTLKALKITTFGPKNKLPRDVKLFQDFLTSGKTLAELGRAEGISGGRAQQAFWTIFRKIKHPKYWQGETKEPTAMGFKPGLSEIKADAEIWIGALKRYALSRDIAL